MYRVIADTVYAEFLDHVVLKLRNDDRLCDLPPRANRCLIDYEGRRRSIQVPLKDGELCKAGIH